MTVICLLESSLSSHGEDTINFEIIKTYSFVKLKENYIHNEEFLNNTFEKSKISG